MQNSDNLKKTLFKFAVIGAGPGGLAAISNLLEKDISPILWIDREFAGGRMPIYRNVPSNTKVKRFKEYVEMSEPFSKFTKEDPSPLQPLEDLQPEDTCNLERGLKMINILTEDVRKLCSDNVLMVNDEVTELRRLPKSSNQSQEEDIWELTLKNNTEIQPRVERVVFATGSSPVEPSVSTFTSTTLSKTPQVIHLDDALDKYKIADYINEEDEVAVVGVSHSAILVLMNIHNLEKQPKTVHNFFRSPIKYAVDYGDWILYDNTGLKGNAAKWAKEVYEPNHVTNLQKYLLSNKETSLYDQILPQCTKIIFAVGYKRDPLPKITIVESESAVTELKDEEISYEDQTGRIGVKKGDSFTKIPGLYGLGIAFPQKVTDRQGNVECSVGYLKFMKAGKVFAQYYTEKL